LYHETISRVGVTIASVLLGFVLTGNTGAEPPKKQVITARIVAQTENNAEDFGSGSFLGYSQHYVLKIEAPRYGTELVKLFYVFKNANEKLPPSYLDYSVVRSFTVLRDSLCDDSLEHMAYTQGFDEEGHPIEHQFTLKMAKGAPKLAITQTKLPCYMMNPDGLKPSHP
jgi:hypothetical protein